MENRLLEIDYLAGEVKRLEKTVQGIAGEESAISTEHIPAGKRDKRAQ